MVSIELDPTLMRIDGRRHPNRVLEVRRQFQLQFLRRIRNEIVDEKLLRMIGSFRAPVGRAFAFERVSGIDD